MKSFYFSLLATGIMGINLVCHAVQVDGYCYLQNQMNHEGTKVLFQADTPGAETDSASADSAGYYQIDLQAGGYDIFYSHEGFQADSILNRIIVSATTLPSVTLIELPHGVYISGALSGFLEDTTYIISDSSLVAVGDSLIIAAGATLYFIRNSSQHLFFRVYGYLSAVGSETDSIKFLSYPGFLSWITFGFWDSPDTSRLAYCLFSGFHLACLECVRASPRFSNCAIIGNGSALSCGESQPEFDRCTFSDNDAQIDLNGGDNAIFKNCIISGCPYEGVWCRGSASIFVNCTITENGLQGIRNTDGSYATIVNCIISNNYIGISFLDSPDVTVAYCDLYGNSLGNFTGTPPPYLGQIAGVNNNGDPCDLFYNIFLNPMFVNPGAGNYHLQSGSPCIDAGDPTSLLDPDSTIADIGAFYFDQLPVNDHPKPIQPNEFRLFPAYPNPFNSSTILSYSIPRPGKATLIIYNVLGQRVETLFDGRQEGGIHSVRWDASNCASGIYCVQMQSQNLMQIQKMVLLR
jgi:hypothetical protein